MKKVFLALMAIAAIALMSCKGDKTLSSSPSVIGIWTCQYEGEYGGIIEGSNTIEEVLIIEEGGALTYEVSAYGEEYSFPSKWFIEGGQFCYLDYVEGLMPEEAGQDTVRVDYKVTDNTLELNDGDVKIYKRVK